MDANFWLQVGVEITAGALGAATILWRMSVKDAVNEANSSSRFDLNERRILDGVKRMDGHDTDIKALTTALAENKVLLATIVERTLHMVKATERIEATLITKT